MADRINFPNPINISVQVGDLLYHVNVDINNNPIGNPDLIGPITEIGENFIIVDGPNATPQQGFFMFQKDNQINVSTLVGYFAEVTLEQSSPEESEIFSVGSEIFVSSK